MVEPKSFHFTRRQSTVLVFLCTVFGAAAQVLIKAGANTLTSNNPLAMLHSAHLLAGYCLYGLNTVLLTLALRDGELSILYPVISLTFIWVMFLSLVFFRESISLPKVLGVLVIVVGVAVLGKGGKNLTTPISSMLLVLVASFIGSFGAVYLKLGSGRLHRQWKTVALNWRLAVGVALYLLSSIFFIWGVRRGELSVLYPVVSLGYIWTLFWSRLFFGEPLTRNKFLGIGLILCGIFLLKLGSG